MQRGGRARNRRKVDFGASQETRHAQGPKQCGERSHDGSNARSEPAAALEKEARAFQRNRAGENGTLVVRYIPGNEIREKTVPTTEEQEETRHTSGGQSFHYKPWDAGIVAAIHMLKGVERSAHILFWRRRA
jgi:hypothetical protein